MEATFKQETTIILTLTEQEAKWLKILIQNPTAEKEAPNHEAMRRAFFEALKHYV